MTLEELNLNKFLYRIQTDELGNSFAPLGFFKSVETPSESIISGEIDGNLILIGGFLRSKGFVSGSAGWQIEADGDAEFSNITLTGGTLKYGKTSFTDSTNAGYILSSSGVYFGSASDASVFKYTIASGVMVAGGWTIASDRFSNGNMKLMSTAEQILIGSATAPLTGTGIFLGKDGSDYEFRAGDPSGDYIHYDGTNWVHNIVEMPKDSNLLGKWSFDEDTGTTAYDESGVGNNGTITSGTYVLGISGRALDFDGVTASSGINYGNVLNNIFTGGGSVSIWINPDGVGGTEVVIDKGRNFGDGWRIMLDDLAGGNYALYFQQSFDVGNGTWKTGVVVPANSWTHIVITYNKSSASNDPVVYLNGASVTLTETETPSGNADSDTGRPLIVGNYEVNDTPLDGTVDEFRLYSAILTARNAKALYQNSVGVKTSTNVLNVSRLVAGTITSKAITLALTEGGGDVKIQAGKTDFGDDSTNGFILGLDDSDSNKAKFEIGSSATKMLKYDGTDLTLTGGILVAGSINIPSAAAPLFSVTSAGVMTAVSGKYIESFTAGENIASGDIVCIKPTSTDYRATADSYTDQANPNTNYGTNVRLKTGADGGGNGYNSYLNFTLTSVPVPERILKATLTLTVRQSSFAAPATMEVGRVTGSWAEGTVTWNLNPATSNDVASNYGHIDAPTLAASPTTLVVDVTNLVRHWKQGTRYDGTNETNYGFRIRFSSAAAGETIDFESDETDNPGTHPILTIVSTQDSDGKVYKADEDDYALCRSIVGVAQETITSGNAVKIQTHGQVTNISSGSNTGGKVYLGQTAGGILTASNNLVRMIKLGEITGTDKIMLAVQQTGVIVEDAMKTTPGATADVRRFYAPEDARYAMVYMTGGTDESQGYFRVDRPSAGVNAYTFKDYSSGAAHDEFIFTWGANYIEINPNFSAYIEGLVFYT